MKVLVHRIGLTLLALAWILTARPAHGQGFAIFPGPTPPPVPVNGILNYTLIITNLGGTLTDLAVTNTFSGNVSFLAASNSVTYTNFVLVVTNGNVLTYKFSVFTNHDFIELAYTVQPLVTGLLTNTIVVTSANITNTATTNIVANVVTAIADLGVSITGPAQQVITNDFTSYILTVTNFGPQAAPGVFLTNTLPPGVIVKRVTPSSPAFTFSGTNMIASLGTLGSSNGLSFTFSIQPTNVELAAFSAGIGAANVLDENPANNVATLNVPILAYLSTGLTVVTNSARTVNVQNGLLEQNILVVNVSNDVPAVRVVVTGLTNQLFNAVGTNNGDPFFYLSAPLANGQSSTMRMQFFSRKPFVLTNGQLHAFGVPLPNWSPPGFAPASTNINFSSIVKMANGDMLLEFPAKLGSTYTIVYSDNLQFSNAMIAPPAITAPGNEVFWIDYGPPTTTNSPAASSPRFYRVYQNP